MPFIEVTDLEFSYSKSVVLSVPHFKVEKGEKIFLFGPSGTGKTTLLEILSGVLVPQKGTVQISDCDLTKLDAAARDAFRAQKIGYIFQNFNLIPYLNVIENILLPKKLNGLADSQVEKRALDLAQELGISSILQSAVTEISVGQQQRVAVARALLAEPELILADEPTSALDFDAREKFLKILFGLCEQKRITLLFVSHDRSLMNLFSRQVSLLEINKVQRQEENV